MRYFLMKNRLQNKLKNWDFSNFMDIDKELKELSGNLTKMMNSKN